MIAIIKKRNKITRMHWCYYTLKIKFQHWKNHKHRHTLCNLSDSPYNDSIASSGLSPSLPKIGVCLLSSFSSCRTRILATLSHASVHTWSVGGTAVALLWICVPHLVCSGVCNIIESLVIEPNTTTLIETQLKSKHFLFIYPKVYSTQSKRTRTTTNPMCVLPLLHHSCISSCHPP